MKKLIALTLAVVMILSVAVIAASATVLEYTVRIEGAQKNLYYSTVTVSTEDDDPINFTLGDVFKEINDEEEDLTIYGIDDGYITQVNDEKAGQFGGSDGWYYSVNGEVPEVGINDFNVKSGDNIVLYYGDFPCQVPVLDVTEAESGVLKVQSYDSVWSQDAEGNWTSVSDWAPVAGATLSLNGFEVKTDDSGIAKFDRKIFKESDTVYVQIEKYSEKGAPQVLRFAPDYNFELGDVPGEDTTAVTEPETYAETSAETEPASETIMTEPASEGVQTEPVTEAVQTEPVTEAVQTEPVTEAVQTEPVTEPVTVDNQTKVFVPADQTVYVGATFKINAKILNSKGNTSYISNRKSIASVSKTGKVTARKKGTAVITVKNNKVSETFKVTVKNPKLNKKKVSLKKGKTFKIKITGKNGKQTYKSSKKSVAKVSKKGKITAKKKGKATITVTTNGGYKLKVKVTVK